MANIIETTRQSEATPGLHERTDLEATDIVPRWNSFVECLRFRATTQPDALAMYDLVDLQERRSPLTYAELERRVRAVAARLQSQGAAGQRALLVMGNDLNYVIAFLACAYAGCTAVNVLPPSRAKHIGRLLHVANDSDASLILSSGARSAVIARKLSEVPRLREMNWVRVDEVPDSEASDYEHVTPDPHDIAYLQYTSGSTGSPRGVMVSHYNLTAHSLCIQREFGFRGDDRGLSWLPLYHDMGLILGVLQPLFSGFPVALTDPLSFVKHPDRWLRAISDHRITYTGGPNFCYDLCVDVVDPAKLEGVDLSSWTVALNGAEPIRGRTLDRFAEAFEPFGWQPTSMHPAYGLAEFTLAAVAKTRGTLPVERDIDALALTQDVVREPRAGGVRSRRVVSSGRAAPGTVIRIVDPATGQEVAPDHTGEIWLAGPSVALGYRGREQDTHQTFRAALEGDPRAYLRTGDLGFVDEGELFVTGRLKDVIVVCGANHHPQDIEESAEAASEAIRPHFVAAFSVEDEGRERVVIVAEVQREAGSDLDVDSVTRRVVLAIAREHEVPVDEVVLVHHGQIPKTTSAKIQRGACRQRWRDRLFRTYGSMNPTKDQVR